MHDNPAEQHWYIDRDIALWSEGCMNKWSLLEITEFLQVLFLIKQQSFDGLF